MAMTREQFTKIQAALLAEGFGIVKLATLPATTTAPTKAATPAATDGRYTCGVCGQKGHNARHHEKPATPAAKPATPAPAKAAPAKPAPVTAGPALDDLDFDVDDFGPAPTTPTPVATPTKAAPAKPATPAAPVEAADAELDTLLSDLL